MSIAPIREASRHRLIVPTGRQAALIEGHKEVERKGGRPLNSDCYSDLVLTDHWKSKSFNYPLTIAEVYIYSKLGGFFKKGIRSVTDCETGLTVVDIDNHLGISDFTGENNKNTVLIVTRIKEFASDGTKDLIIPGSISIAHAVARSVEGLVQSGGKIIDQNADCLPRIVAQEEFTKLSWKEQAWFTTIRGQGVRPGIRGMDSIDDLRTVVADVSHYNPGGLAYLRLA